jgi:CRP/FNR family transcriptional regulator, anaerobic regulatory protein
MHPDHLTIVRSQLRGSLQRGDEKLKALLRESGRSAPAGHVLIRSGSEHEYVYRLRSGWACRNRAIADGREQIILMFVPGDVFAVKSLFLTRHPDNVQLLSAAVVERVHQNELREAFAQDADIANRCMWQVVEEERRLHSWVFGLGQGSAEERLAMLVLDVRGRLVLASEISPDADSFEFPLTQVQVSECLGITPVHANRIVKAFRERRIVVFQNGRATIQDFVELRRIAEPLMDVFERSVSEYDVPVSAVDLAQTSNTRT